MRTYFLLFVSLVFSISTKAEVPSIALQAEQQFLNEQFDSAINSYSQLIAEFPERKDIFFNRGLCFYKTNHYSEAIADFDKAAESDSLKNTAQLWKAYALEKEGKVKEAMVLFEQLSAQNTTSTLLIYRIKLYHTAVILSNNWYYMIAMALLIFLLLGVVAKSMKWI